MCHSVPVFLRARFNPLQFFNALQGRNHKTSQPDASMHPSDAFSPLRMAFTNATHHTSNASLLQASLKPCCDLPKQNTFPLLLLCLLYSNSSPHYNTFHTHKILLRCSFSQLPQNITRTERKHSGNIKSQHHKRLRHPQVAGVALWHARGGNFSNHRLLRTMQHDIGKVAYHHTITTPHLILLCITALKIYNFKPITKQLRTFITQYSILLVIIFPATHCCSDRSIM